MSTKSALFRSRMQMLKSLRFRISPRAAFNCIKGRVFSQRAELRLRTWGPQLLQWLITRRCNLKCNFCKAIDINPDADWRQFEAQPGDVDRILANPIGKNILGFALSGGEPLLNEHLPEIIGRLRKRGRIVALTTNGLLLGSTWTAGDLEKAGLNWLGVSVYDDHLDKLADILNRATKSISVNCNKILRKTVMLEQPRKIWDAVRMARDSGCALMHFQGYFAIDEDDADLIYDDDQASYAEFQKETEERFKGFPMIWSSPIVRNPPTGRYRCARLWKELIMDATGNLGICCNEYPHIDVKNSGGGGGGFFTDDPHSVLNRPAVLAMRKMLDDPQAGIPPLCRKCHQLYSPFVRNR